MLFLLLLALTLKLSSSVCLTANLFDPWADDGWEGATLKIKTLDGAIAYEVTQRDNVAANTPDPHSFCLACGSYKVSADGSAYDGSFSFAIIGDDDVEIVSGSGGAEPAGFILGCASTCPPGSSPNADDECSLCAVGKYSLLEDYQTCSKCPPSTFSTSISATSSSTCITCAPSLASSSGSSECVEPSTTTVSSSADLATALLTITALDTLVVAASPTAYIHYIHFHIANPSAISCSTITVPPSCTFDGKGSRRLFYINTGFTIAQTSTGFTTTTQTSSLVGMTFKQGKAPEDSTEGRGGGLWVRHSKVDVEHCLFEDNTSRYIYTSTFSGTAVVGGRGGGLAITHLSIVTVTHTTFQNNVAAVGGGIYVDQGSVAAFEDSQIRDNQALGATEASYSGAYGGGVAAEDGSTVSFKNTTISDNSASAYGGGIALGEDSTLTMADSFVTANTASVTGGGLQVGGDSSADVHNAKFIDNHVKMEADLELADLSGGGAIAVNNVNFGNVTLHSCSFADNTDNIGKAADIFVKAGSATVDPFCPKDNEVSLVPNCDMQRHALHSSLVHTCVCLCPPLITHLCDPLFTHVCGPLFTHVWSLPLFTHVCAPHTHVCGLSLQTPLTHTPLPSSIGRQGSKERLWTRSSRRDRASTDLPFPTSASRHVHPARHEASLSPRPAPPATRANTATEILFAWPVRPAHTTPTEGVRTSLPASRVLKEPPLRRPP